MDASNLGLLVAISAPVAAIAALHVWLALNGERDTLLLPHTGKIESNWCPACVVGAMAKASARARVEANALRVAAANDESVRESA